MRSVRAFRENLRDAVPIQRVGQFRPTRFLDTMHRPQCLRQTVQFDLLEHLRPG